MTTQYEQFLNMLDNVKQFSPRVYGSKSIKLAQDPHYDLVEMSSSAGQVMWGFSRERGKLRDIIGPILLPHQYPRSEVRYEDISKISPACVFQASVGRG